MSEKEAIVTGDVELRRLRIDRLFEAADRVAAVPLTPMTEAEVEAEVEAARSRPRASKVAMDSRS